MKKGPTSKFGGGQFEAWEKVKLANMKIHELGGKFPFFFLFFLSFFLCQRGMLMSFSLLAFKKGCSSIKGDANELELVGTFF